MPLALLAVAVVVAVEVVVAYVWFHLVGKIAPKMH